MTVLAVDLERKRISLTLKKQPAAGAGEGCFRKFRARPQQIKPRNEKVPFNNQFAAVFGKK